MSSTTPINGLPIPDDSSPNDPPIHFGALATQLDTRLLPRFANAAARNSAITSPQPGMYCHMLDDNRLWVYSAAAAAWTWAKGAQGLLGSAQYSGSNLGLADSPGTIAAFNITGLTIPARRNIALRLRIAGAPASSGYSAYTFDMFLNGVSTAHRIAYAPLVNVGVGFNFESPIQVATALTNVGANVSGSLISGVSFQLVADSLHGPAVFSVVDMGGY